MRRHLFLATVLLSACGSPRGGEPAPRVEPAPAPPPTTPAPGAAASLTLNAHNTKVQFVGSKVTSSHTGGFDVLTGTLELAPDLTRSQLRIEIDTRSVHSDNPRLTRHLKDEDFFHVDAHPRATFVSTGIQPTTDGGTHQVTGDLDLRGVKKQITFPATIKVTADAVEARAELSIDRKAFGIIYDGMADNLIRDEVALTVEMNLPRGSAS